MFFAVRNTERRVQCLRPLWSGYDPEPATNAKADFERFADRSARILVCHDCDDAPDHQSDETDDSYQQHTY